MSQAALVIIAVAEELADLARRSMPVLRKGETVRREWFKNAVFYRETDLKGRKFVAEFDFRLRKSRRTSVKNAISNA